MGGGVGFSDFFVDFSASLAEIAQHAQKMKSFGRHQLRKPKRLHVDTGDIVRIVWKWRSNIPNEACFPAVVAQQIRGSEEFISA